MDSDEALAACEGLLHRPRDHYGRRLRPQRPRPRRAGVRRVPVQAACHVRRPGGPLRARREREEHRRGSHDDCEHGLLPEGPLLSRRGGPQRGHACRGRPRRCPCCQRRCRPRRRPRSRRAWRGARHGGSRRRGGARRAPPLVRRRRRLRDLRGVPRQELRELRVARVPADAGLLHAHRSRRGGPDDLRERHALRLREGGAGGAEGLLRRGDRHHLATRLRRHSDRHLRATLHAGRRLRRHGSGADERRHRLAPLERGQGPPA
mmetsp:Transcript_74747/g.216962  ORF Transcript_74747/g.216962 Transcript_74747/m.216962 type:complete len:263 (-) Transcript_74747:317-1105(-)